MSIDEKKIEEAYKKGLEMSIELVNNIMQNNNLTSEQKAEALKALSEMLIKQGMKDLQQASDEYKKMNDK